MTDVVTGEAVVLDVPCARFPSRLVAIVIDMTAQILLVVALLLIKRLGKRPGALLDEEL